jgi:hypothetical protein
MDMHNYLHAPAAISPGKVPQYILDRRMSRPQSRYERCEEEKNLAPQESNPAHLARSLSLYRLISLSAPDLYETQIYIHYFLTDDSKQNKSHAECRGDKNVYTVEFGYNVIEGT